jgi:hypothetical protein
VLVGCEGKSDWGRGLYGGASCRHCDGYGVCCLRD